MNACLFGHVAADDNFSCGLFACPDYRHILRGIGAYGLEIENIP